MNVDVASAERLRSHPNGITLRLYRQGLGDCFLLALRRADGGDYYVLIDCGVILGTPEAARVMEAVVRDIAAATGGRIDLLVITHEHWDHVSGFIQAEEFWRSLNIRIEKVWMAWTEDMTIPLARRLKQDFQNDLDALRLALDRLDKESPESTKLSGLLGLFGDQREFMAAAKEKRRFSEVTHEAIKVIRDLAGNRVEYRTPGETLTLPDVPGAQIYVLGPPKSEPALRNINPSKKNPQTYSSKRHGTTAPLSEKTAFTLALRHGGSADAIGKQLNDLEKALVQQCFPFEKPFRIGIENAAGDDFFRRHYGFDEKISALRPSPAASGTSPASSALSPGAAWRRISDLDGFGLARRASARKKSAVRKKSVGRKKAGSVDAVSQAPPEQPSLIEIENQFPFDSHLRVDLEIAARMPFFYEFLRLRRTFRPSPAASRDEHRPDGHR